MHSELMALVAYDECPQSLHEQPYVLVDTYLLSACPHSGAALARAASHSTRRPTNSSMQPHTNQVYCGLRWQRYADGRLATGGLET